jgi:uncharacterized membrane protein
MSRAITWVWRRGVVSTFLAGLFFVLPILITLAIMGWAGGLLAEWLGPNSAVGHAFTAVGLKLDLVDNATIATVIGWALVLVAIWAIGVAVKTTAKHRAENLMTTVMERVPILKSIYGPVAQVVGMMKGSDESQMKSMSVVYCGFGAEHGGGFLALLAGPEIYRFTEQECHLVYIPTSPVPMSGGIVFVPKDQIQEVDMDLDQLMQIYFSLGVMATKTVPQQYRVVAESA